MYFYIIYSSKPVGKVDEQTIQDITKISRINNEANDITGMLIYVEDEYLQYIEGDEQKVRSLFEHIKNDTRHQKVQKSVYGYTEERVFKQWSMDSWIVSSSEYRENQALIDLQQFLEDPLNEDLASKKYMEIMRRVIENRED